jgi:FkbH-like protein
VILTLCSKNNEKDVLEVLRRHPDMLIKEAHLASWRINWIDKVSNIKSLAMELNIGLDSFVLIDDSDFEINHVREQLPQVTTIHLKGNTADYRRELSKMGLFDSLTFTTEDRRRNAMYGENRQRKEIEASSDSMDAYLQKLGIEVDISAVAEFDIQRVSQLTQKTNQFNLTTRRYSEGQIKDLIADSKSDVYCIKVRDKISDLGLVGVSIVRYQDDGQFIDSFLLSCRALGRGVELAMLSAIVNQNMRQTCKPLVYGQFLGTAKNSQVQDFYSMNKFELAREDEHSCLWVLDAREKTVGVPSWLKVTFGGKSE